LSETAPYREQAAEALAGCEVWRVAFDYQTRLLLIDRHPDGSTRVSADLIIETGFVLRDAAGTTHELDPGTSRRALAPVIDLFMRTVRTVAIGASGALVLEFDDGAKLTVHPQPEYEAWELVGDGVPKIVVLPGGGVAVWDA